MSRKNKSTSFKLTDQYEAKLLAHAESEENGDYSKYIKRLIGRDMESQDRPLPVQTIAPTIPEFTTDDFSAFI